MEGTEGGHYIGGNVADRGSGSGARRVCQRRRICQRRRFCKWWRVCFGGSCSGSLDVTPVVDTPAEEVGEEVLAPAPAPKQKAASLPTTGEVSPLALVSVAILVSGAAFGVVVLRRRNG